MLSLVGGGGAEQESCCMSSLDTSPKQMSEERGKCHQRPACPITRSAFAIPHSIFHGSSPPPQLRTGRTQLLPASNPSPGKDPPSLGPCHCLPTPNPTTFILTQHLVLPLLFAKCPVHVQLSVACHPTVYGVLPGSLHMGQLIPTQ